MKAICQSPHLTALTPLRLRCTDASDKGAKEIAASGVLKRLKVLDLQHGCITDDGAKALAASPDLPRLTLLNISSNALTKAGVKALRETGVNLIADRMHDTTAFVPDDDNEFLWQGDGE